MTSYTRNQRLPYPASANERGNGALDLQLLAERADALLDGLDTNWAAQLNKPSIVLTLTTPQTGLIISDYTGVLMDTLVVAKGGMSGLQTVFPPPSLAGWWLYTACLSTRPSGTIGGIRRQMEIRVQGTTPGGGGLKTLDTFRMEEFDNGVAAQDTVVQGEAMIYLDGASFVQPYVFHNAGSTLTVNANSTFVTATRISAG